MAQEKGNQYSWYADNDIPDAIKPYLSHIPNHPACFAALKLVYESVQTPIFNHSLRVYRYAKWLSQHDPPNAQESWSLQLPSEDLLFLATVLHDIGTSGHVCGGPLRFEVEGSNTAVDLMRQFGYTAKETREVWIAIACHTSPHIGENIGPLANLVRRGVLLDFATIRGKESHALADEFESDLPRLEIERILAEEVVKGALKSRSKAPHASWPDALLRGHEANPGHEGVNPEF